MSTAAAGAVWAVAAHGARAHDESPAAPRPVDDTNVSLFQWPFRRLPLDDADKLVEKLHSLGITQAWAGSFEGLLQRDIAGVNRRLAAACRRHSLLVAIGSINLELPGWQDDLRRCFDEHSMPGIRLHPNYHGYGLDDARFARLLALTAEAGRFVQIAASMEDARTQHRLVQVPDVDLTPLVQVMRDVPVARVQILNWRPRMPLVEQLAEQPRIYFDTARVEGTDGVPQLVRHVSPDRVLLGSHAPFLIPEAALIRIHESGLLEEAELRALLGGNAERLLGRGERKE